MLVVSRKPDQAVLIGEHVRVVVVGIDPSGKVRLGIDAPGVPVLREELAGRPGAREFLRTGVRPDAGHADPAGPHREGA